MKKALTIALLLCGCFAPLALADEASHRKAALELLQVTNAKKTMEQMLTFVENSMQQQFDAMDLPPEAREDTEAYKREFMGWMSEFFVWEQFRDMYVDIYVEVFTEAEIRELIEFYESPTGQKFLAKMPELLRKSMEKTQALLQNRMPEIQERLQKVMEELEEKYEDEPSAEAPQQTDPASASPESESQD